MQKTPTGSLDFHTRLDRFREHIFFGHFCDLGPKSGAYEIWHCIEKIYIGIAPELGEEFIFFRRLIFRIDVLYIGFLSYI